MVAVAGVDLRGSGRKPSGIAILHDKGLYINRLYSDEEILRRLLEFNVKIVAVDSPLAHSSSFRHVDKTMIKLGLRVLPPGWRGMRMLVERGIKLASSLSSLGILVLETHPRSALKTSRCGNLGELASKMGVPQPSGLSRDEEDALIAAFVSLKFLQGEVIEVEGVDGRIFLLPPVC
jgi:predicted nuclease with RNAse H fold